jgi:hypothetical protein
MQIYLKTLSIGDCTLAKINRPQHAVDLACPESDQGQASLPKPLIKAEDQRYATIIVLVEAVASTPGSQHKLAATSQSSPRWHITT